MSKNLSQQVVLDRRGFVAATFATVAGLGLAGCSDTSAEADKGSAAGSSKSSEDTEASTTLDAKAFDKLVDNGPKADDDAITGSTWAAAVKDAGVFKIGGVQTSTLFSLLNEKDGQTRGFDAGIAQLLSNYILGENKVEITQVTSDTRESVLQNGQVDAVFATYTITDERKKLVSFAGPYYYTQQAILVLADNDDIKGVDDLADKNVAVQSGSNGPAILEEFAPKASQQEFKTDEEARQALQQGRVDAYVIDNNMQQSALVREPGKYKIAGKPFGSKEPYGIGLPLDSDGVAFVNDFLKKIEDDGTWTELWQICIGDRTGDTNVPELPEIGSEPGNDRNETIRKRMMRFIAVNCFLTELSGLPYTREPLSLSAGGPHESLRALVALWPELYRRAASNLGHDA